MFAEILKNLRKNKGLTQIQFAEIFNISSGTIAMWETNKRIPDTSMLIKIAEYFGVTVDYLLGNSNTPTVIPDTQLEDVYLSFAKEARDEGIRPEDIRLAIETIKTMRSKNKTGGDSY